MVYQQAHHCAAMIVHAQEHLLLSALTHSLTLSAHRKQHEGLQGVNCNAVMNTVLHES